MIWNKARECISRDEMKNIQGTRLVKLVKYVYKNVKYYKEKMQEAGIEPGDIRGIEDLEKLPFTTKEDIIKAYPDDIYAAPKSEIVRYHASKGIGDEEIIIGYTQNDIDMWSECVARAMNMAGLDKNDVVQIAYAYGMTNGGFGAHYGAEKVGAAVVPCSVGSTYNLINMMKSLDVTGIMCTPTYLLRIADIIEKQKMEETLKLKTAICSTEPFHDKVRAKIEKSLGIKAYNSYSLSVLSGVGIASECECRNGMHIQEDFFAVEVINNTTLNPMYNGERGEMVFTTLCKEGIPLIRYRTNKTASLTYDKCECGRTTIRMNLQ